jgi:hypothetical protein
MKILCWNCHGLGYATAVRALLDVMRRYYHDVVFLSETHLEDYPAECLKRKVKMDFKIVQDFDGRTSRKSLIDEILFLWRTNFLCATETISVAHESQCVAHC